MSTYSFTGNKVSFTYQRLLQISDGGDGNPTGIIYDGYGATVTIADENINYLYTTVNNLISTGIAGSTGPTGVQGWQGPIGLTGESVTGAQGVYGPTGFQGNTGPQGFQGPIGLTGIGTTGNQGETGPQGYQGITGPQGAGGGATGSQGNTGPQGLQGDLGPQGNTGPQGYQGITGPQGTTGSQGNTGPQGYQGITGPQGFQGIVGPTGSSILPYKYVTSTYSITSDDYYIESVGTFTINLPTAIGATGKGYLIKNSGTGVITIGTTASQLIDNLTSYNLDFYDTLDIVSNGSNWNVQQPQTKTFTRVYNNTGSIIPKGKALKIQSTYNGIPAVTLPIASGTGSQQVIGLAYIDIPIASEGIAISAGILSGLNLASYSVGDILYLSDTVPGGFVNSTTSLLYSSRTNQIGYVTSNSSTLGTIQVEINNEDVNLSLTDIQRNILEGNVISGGIFQFPAPGITISSATTVNISSMRGWIVDNAGPITSTAPIAKLIEYPGATGVTLSNITTATETYFLVNSNGVLTQQTSFPTPRQRRENIYLGKAGHANKSTIANAFPEPDIDVSPAAQVRDMFTPIKLINNGVYPSYIGATLSFQTSAGTLWGLGIGYTRDVLNPSSIDIPATSPTIFQYRLRNGGTYSNTTLIDPGFWDNGGVRTAVGSPAKQATNQRIFLIQNGIFRVQYGQTKYADLTTALANVQNEIFDTFVNFRDNGILIGILSVVSNATNLSDPLQAKFLLVSKFGETVGAAGGLSTTTLQQAYDNSGEPEIVTNSILDGITFRRGTAADTDNVFVVQNGSASNTFYVRGDGNTWASNLHLTNIGLTSSATKYMVVNDSGDVFYQTTIIGGGGATGPVGPTGAGGALGYYGSFYDTTNQLNPTASTAMVMTINSTYESNGVSIVDGSKMTFAHPGTYNIQFSTVFAKTNSSAGLVDVWFAKNGQYITASNTEFNAAGQASSIASWNFMLTLNANDYVQLYWSSPATDIAISSTGTQSNPLRPSVPSIILTAQQVMYTQLGPTGSTGFQGVQGIEGSTGTQGFQGVQGFQGIEGITGPQGFQGIEGITGPQGFQGFQGIEGPTGTQGFQGVQGIEGSTGPQGFQGVTGDYSPFYYQDTAPPTTLPIGSRWFDSSTGEELVLIDDTDSKQWVQPYSSGSGGGGGGGGIGTQGPQGISGIGSTGTQGPQGLQGDPGPQGPGSSSFLYINVLFVHPDGDDGSAVIGDRSLPFNTLSGAIAAAASVTNPVIEVWSGDTYDPITPVYEYTENTSIVISYDLTIYLKPNVHVRFIPSALVSSFFSIVGGSRVNIVGDEKGSSFVLDASSKTSSRFFDVIGAKLYMENMSIYFDYGNLTVKDTAFNISHSGKGAAQTILSLRNCYLEFLEPGEAISDFSAITNEAATIEIDSCQLYMASNSDKGSGVISFIKNDVSSLVIDCNNRIRNSQFITIRNVSSLAVFSVVYNSDPEANNTSTLTIDDCEFYIDSNVGSKGAGPFVLVSDGSFKNVSLVSRSIHNYSSTDDASVTYITGNPSSLSDLGITGYGFLEKYAKVNIPFIRK
jgi:hypothetical protein